MKARLGVIGNGMAGIKAVEKLASYAPGDYQITVFSEENYPAAYNRILLSSVLSGEKKSEDIITHSLDWYEQNSIEFKNHCKIVGGDLSTFTLMDENGQSYKFDQILFATGSVPIKIPIPGAHLPQVLTFRDIDDVNIMLGASRDLKEVVVIGGGLLGLEAAYGLKNQGMNVTVVHLMQSLMERQLDYRSGKLLERKIIEKGINILTEKSTVGIIEKDGGVCGVEFDDGQIVRCDLVVMAIGIKPRVDLAKKLGLEVNRGIVINECLETSAAGVYALGECVEFNQQTFGLVAPLYDMAEVFARNLQSKVKSNPASHTYKIRQVATKLKVSGIQMFSQGTIESSDGQDEIMFSDAKSGIYKKIVVDGDTVQGVVLLGNTEHANWYSQLIEQNISITNQRETLLFGPDNSRNDSGKQNSVVNLSSEAEICGCNGVTKGTIVSALAEKGLKSLKEVKLCTKAATGCGSCEGSVEVIFKHYRSEINAEEKTQIKEGICACTSHDHGYIRSAINNGQFSSLDEVFKKLNWKTLDGCHRCRPALNYYLLCANPLTYQDHRRSRFVNERVHANIQKDGTYSVIPRMFGGMTSVKELRAIADVAETFNVPSIKVTGGQRIDLLGIKKSDLPKVWGKLNDAGMVSGHAYGKAVRTVKTCVGSEWCRFGTQDSTKMGIDLEKALWGSWTPHKFKLAVSGCPRNCAESTIKDLGVVAVDSGWEIYVGGNGGAKVRVSDFLCKVKTDNEVMEYTCAFIQLYREQANYLDRSSHWIEKVGLDFIKDRIVHDPDSRNDLVSRFQLSQKDNQTDPWQSLPRSSYGPEEFDQTKLREMP